MAYVEPELNPVITSAIEELLKGLPHPVTHGQFNRHMFLEAVVLKGGVGAAIEAEDIMRYGHLTDAEFTSIKNEYIAEGILKAETNLFGVTLYSLQYTKKENP